MVSFQSRVFILKYLQELAVLRPPSSITSGLMCYPELPAGGYNRPLTSICMSLRLFCSDNGHGIKYRVHNAVDELCDALIYAICVLFILY